MRDLRDIPDLELVWRERVERVRHSRARTVPVGMTRPPRNLDERIFLDARGALGPFVEVAAWEGTPAPARRGAEAEEPEAEEPHRTG
jgi:hypothetical protein